MLTRYGVEMKIPTKTKKPGYFARIVKQAAEAANIIDRDRRLFIVESKQEADALAELYDSKDMLEERFSLYELTHADKMDAFRITVLLPKEVRITWMRKRRYHFRLRQAIPNKCA
jgi:hypothetical protein